MKANEAPEKIYLDQSVLDDIDNYDSHNPLFLKNSEDETIDKCSIEYCRTNIFIEKAIDFLKDILTSHFGYYAGADILKNFEKYMKGE